MLCIMFTISCIISLEGKRIISRVTTPPFTCICPVFKTQRQNKLPNLGHPQEQRVWHSDAEVPSVEQSISVTLGKIKIYSEEFQIIQI